MSDQTNGTNPQTNQAADDDQASQATQGNPEVKEEAPPKEEDSQVVAALKAVEEGAQKKYEETQGFIQDAEKLLSEEQNNTNS
jgi:hypothetical protein